jgi:hypothetical protein
MDGVMLHEINYQILVVLHLQVTVFEPLSWEGKTQKGVMIGDGNYD